MSSRTLPSMQVSYGIRKSRKAGNLLRNTWMEKVGLTATVRLLKKR